MAFLQKKDYPSALDAFQAALNEGYYAAALKLGRLHSEGTAIERDTDKALAYFQQLSDSGDGEGEHQLGLIHFHGTGW